MIENLPWGYCRLLTIGLNSTNTNVEKPGTSREDAGDDDGLSRASSSATTMIFGPVFVVLPSRRSTAICDIQPAPLWRGNSKGEVSSSQLGLCFHHDNDKVRLVTWKDDDDPAFIMDVVRSLTRKRYRILLEDQPSHHLSYDCPNPTNHHHARICTDLLLDDIDPGVSTDGFLGVLESTPTPLLSLTLTLFLNSDSDLPTSNNNDLFLASLKRQIVGVCVVFVDRKVTTELTLILKSTKNKNSERGVVGLRVQSVVAKSKQAGSIHLGIVLPSTRITILPQSATKRQVSSTATSSVPESISSSEPIRSAPAAGTTIIKQQRTPSKPDKEDPSVTRLLVETVRCLRNSSKALVSKSFLLAGPPGVGKTFAVKKAYDTCKTEGPTFLLSLGSMLGSSGGSPSEVSRLLEKRFEKAARECHKDAACVGIIFIDECDALLSSDHVAGMLASVLDRCSQNGKGWQRLVVVAATNRVDSIPSYLRRPGRFDKEVHIGPPMAEERFAILETLIATNAGSSVMSAESLLEIAEACVGYVPADLAALVRRAFGLALEGGVDSIEPDLFQRAMADVGASALRDSSLAAPPGTSWDDIAGNLRAKVSCFFLLLR